MTTLPIIRTASELRSHTRSIRERGKRVAFVPTMGALHEGHLRLVDEARKRADHVIVSIFVNPTQFGPGEDLDRYPRQLERDTELLSKRSTNLIFAPEASVMYPNEFRTSVRVESLTEHLCGAHRPGHFDGVTTVVAKLLNIVGPCVAVFGRKDFQQLQVITRMVLDLEIPAEIIGVPTVRETDGLAMSSRNEYLSPKERNNALSLSQGLAEAHKTFALGERRVGELLGIVRKPIELVTDNIDYITAAHPNVLLPLSPLDTANERLLIAIAATIGKTRLIDNTVLGEDSPPKPR